MTLYFFGVFIVFLFLFQLFLLLYLTERKKRRRRYEEAIEKEYIALIEPFSSYVMEESDPSFMETLQASTHQEVVLERLLNGYLAFTKEGHEAPFVKILSETFLADSYRRILGQRSWARRLNTLHYIEDFRITSLTPFLLEKLASARKLDAETQQLVRTLASLDEEQTIRELQRFPDVPARLYIDVLSRLKKATADRMLHELLESGDLFLKHAAFTFIGQSGALSFLPAVEEELQSGQTELRIQALKTIYRLVYMSDPDLLAPFFKSPVWAERMFAARIAGVLQLSRYNSMLSTLLGDSVWWVRYSAAEAFARFSEGDVMLAHLAENHPDRYGRDMAAQWQTYRPGGIR